MITSEKDIVPPDSAIFGRFFCVNFFHNHLVYLSYFVSSIFWRRLQVTTQSIDQPTYEWFKNNQNDLYFALPKYTNTSGIFIKMHVNTWDACFAYMYMIQSMEEAQQANLETAPEYAHIKKVVVIHNNLLLEFRFNVRQLHGFNLCFNR